MSSGPNCLNSSFTFGELGRQKDTRRRRRRCGKNEMEKDDRRMRRKIRCSRKTRTTEVKE
jgi:hypothetical protein